MRSYKGHRDQQGALHVTVTDASSAIRALPTRLDLARHSPTGFEVGYAGSGPAQLALAILADALNAAREPEAVVTVLGTLLRAQLAFLSIALIDRDLHTDRRQDADTVALRLYQQFKFERLVSLDRDSWTITNDDVRQWIEGVIAKIEADPNAWGRR